MCAGLSAERAAVRGMWENTAMKPGGCVSAREVRCHQSPLTQGFSLLNPAGWANVQCAAMLYDVGAEAVLALAKF